MKVPEMFRVKTGPMSSDRSFGNNGAFLIELNGKEFVVIVSDGLLWEHVSVSTRDRCPTWEEMCMIKDLFWDEEECVVQYHPPRSEWVNNHPFCLHLWKPLIEAMPRPPKVLVGT